MTNEEIDEKVEVLCLLANDMGFSIPESALTHFARELVSQALEEAAGAQCPYCKRGLPIVVERRPDGTVWHDYHHEKSSGYPQQRGCMASPIRALRDSLVPVESAST